MTLEKTHTLEFLVEEKNPRIYDSLHGSVTGKGKHF